MNTDPQKRNNNVKYSAIAVNQREVFIMNYLEIENVIGREIIDSRGNPTVEAEVWLADGTVARALLRANLKRSNSVTATSHASAARAFRRL